MLLERSSCSCEKCQAACHRMPGIFRPGEPALAAELLGLTADEFVGRYCATVKTFRGTLAVIPMIVGSNPGDVYKTFDRGRCVFLTEAGRCGIYTARPYECSHGNPCDQTPERLDAYYEASEETARLWEAVR